MRTATRASLRPIRAVLVIAALLHLGSGEAGSWTHLREISASAQQGAAPGLPAETPDVPQHSEEQCVLCHSLLSAALAAAPASLPISAFHAAGPPPSSADPELDVSRILPHARGPPFA